MATLTFIGLANYKSVVSTTCLVNIIFTSTGSETTTYEYNFSTTVNPVNDGWINIPTLINVTIPANREISAQLNTTQDINNTEYYLYIKASNSINTIWQRSARTLVAVILGDENTIVNFNDNRVPYVTLAGGSIVNLINTSLGGITSNIIYADVIARIQIPVLTTYTAMPPIFIMSKANTIINSNSNLTTTNGSINIVGSHTFSAGILINLGVSIFSGNITFNGVGNGIINESSGINISGSINCIGNITFNGVATTASNGIEINGNIITTNTGNVILNGRGGNGIFIPTAATAININGIITINGTGIINNHGIVINRTTNITGTVILNGNGLPDSASILINGNINCTGIVKLIGTAGNNTGTCIQINKSITCITGNVTINGTTANGNAILLNTAGIIITGNVALTGTTAGNGVGIFIGVNGINIQDGDVILTGTGSENVAGRHGISINGVIVSTANVVLNGIASGNGLNSYGILLNGSINSTRNFTLNGTATSGNNNGIAINANINITGTVIINGKSTNSNGVLLNSNLSINGNVFFSITITNSILSYINRNNGIITGLINILIDPSSILSVPGNYNLLQNILATNIGITTGLVNNIRWNIISTSLNNWALVTVASNLVNGDISGSNIVIDNKYYTLSSSGDITFKFKLYDVSSILELQGILVTSSKNGTILYISDINISSIIATGLYGITTIMQDNDNNIYYTIIFQELFYIYKLGTNGNANKLVLQGRGKNIQIFYYFGYMIVVNTDTNIISTYKFVYDIKLEFIYKTDVSNLGIIINIINNNKVLLFLFNNNTVYKFNTINMKILYFTNISYIGIALANNTLYGIINNGGILYSEKILPGYLLTNN